MGWGYGHNAKGREVGYNVESTCDFAGCNEKIDRGLGYACGGQHGENFSQPPYYCDGYFCFNHEWKHNCPAELMDDLCSVCDERKANPEASSEALAICGICACRWGWLYIVPDGLNVCGINSRADYSAWPRRAAS